MKHLRYRVGIDVGLYSVGLSAIEIDDSSDDPRSALPIRLLSTMSVIHDGGVDPEKAKSADSRKATSGVARRTRTMRKRKRERLSKLDEILEDLGYPVAQAKAIAEGTDALDPDNSAYPTWRARRFAVEKPIENDRERLLAITIATRHIARHRGWRNPYASVASVIESSTVASAFYEEFFKKVQLAAYAAGGEDALYPGVTVSCSEEGKPIVNLPESLMRDPLRPTLAELIDPFLSSGADTAFRRDPDKTHSPSVPIGKLHQSDYCHEILRIFTVQNVPEDHRKALLDQVFYLVNPRSVGAAAKLVAPDSLPGQSRFPRAGRASLAFQRYRILTTVTNLRIGRSSKTSRPLTQPEIEKAYGYLCEKGTESTTWHDIAAVLGIDRSNLKGVGGQTQDGIPISSKQPPVLDAEIIIRKEAKNELAPLREWWESSTDLEKEALIQAIGNAGVDQSHYSDEELRASEEVNAFLQTLSDKALEKLEGIALPSGRASYSVNSLLKLNKRMLDEGVDLHTARSREFGVGDAWKPESNPLGTPTGNPAADRTITIVSRWLKACESRWGKPETINIEHVREGFSSPKKARKDQMDADKRFRANLKVRESIVEALRQQDEPEERGVNAIRHADIRRYQAVQRQNCQCIYCGKKISFQTAQMDHIVPRKGAGSSNELPNLVAACADCNISKSNRLFYHWAETDEKRREVLERVGTWNQNSYFTSSKQFKSYLKDVKSRLMQTEEDDPLDARSIESTAWMARELRTQIEGHFGYRGATAGATSGNDEFTLQRVNVFRGSLTAEARRAAGLEKALPWIGGNDRKTRLDRRHHAVDASVIAMMRPAVGKTLAEREEIRREQVECNVPIGEGIGEDAPWKQYVGHGEDSDLYLLWRDEQMAALRSLLCKAMEDDRIIVSNHKRLRLGSGRAHEDTILPLIKRHVGDALSCACIDKAESPALWVALTSQPDYDPENGLPENSERRIRIHDRWLSADDEIGFMAKTEEDLDKAKDAVYMPVRNGFAAIGNTIHHARFFRIPKVNSKGVRTGWQFSYMRVFQTDLLRHAKEDLFAVDLPPQSISRRSATPKLRKALQEGSAEYLGWAVVGDEVQIDPSYPAFSPEGKNAISLFMKAFPGTKRFKVIGFPTWEQIKLAPLMLSSEGIDDKQLSDEKAIRKLYGDHDWTREDIKSINTILGIGGSYHPSVDVLLRTSPCFVRRNTLGEIRWKSANHMPSTWRVTPHPKME